MSTNLPIPASGEIPAANTARENLFAAVDMGTNSFKLLIVRADPSTGRLLIVDRHKERVLLGLNTTTTICTASQLRAAATLRRFQNVLESHRVPSFHSRLVATSAVREASNQSQFVHTIHETLGLKIDVLSGVEEARLIYLGVLQFHPVHDRTVLTIDIGGGSTEFVIGKEGRVLFAISLALGHVTLTQNYSEIAQMREHVRVMIRASGLIEGVKKYDVERVIGSSGTIRNIEKAVSLGYARNLEGNVGMFEERRRDWSFTKGELRGLMERLSEEERRVEGKARRQGFFKKRSEFIVAGAVLLEEIFEELKIEEMEVSAYALGEGVIAEKLGEVFDGYDLKANARWWSVVRLATRFNNKEQMKSAALCFSIAKEMFEGLKKWNGAGNGSDGLVVSLDEKDLEYLEAACLLHNIGLYVGKKGHHKQAFRIIMNGNHLHGYNDEEVKLIALLVRHHRKKFPKLKHGFLEEFTEEVRGKFRILCSIVRVCAAVERLQLVNIDSVEFSHTCEGYKLVLKEGRNSPPPPGNVLPFLENFEAELDKELKDFRKVFREELSIAVSSSTS